MSRIVLKCGGAVADGAARAALELAVEGHEVCVVHGAGPQISAELRRRRLEVAFVGGRRVTSAATLEVVRASLLWVNEAVCAAVGPAAVGLLGDELGLRARQLPELGLVGEPVPGPVPAVEDALVAGRIPVVAPLAAGPEAPLAAPASGGAGFARASVCAADRKRRRHRIRSLNVNADEAAAAIAIGLGADRLLFVTDVDGVFLEGRYLCAIGAESAESLLGDGSFEGGIVPKLTAAVRAAREGVRSEIGMTAVLA